MVGDLRPSNLRLAPTRMRSVDASQAEAPHTMSAFCTPQTGPDAAANGSVPPVAAATQRPARPDKAGHGGASGPQLAAARREVARLAAELRVVQEVDDAEIERLLATIRRVPSSPLPDFTRSGFVDNIASQRRG